MDTDFDNGHVLRIQNTHLKVHGTSGHLGCFPGQIWLFGSVFALDEGTYFDDDLVAHTQSTHLVTSRNSVVTDKKLTFHLSLPSPLRKLLIRTSFL